MRYPLIVGCALALGAAAVPPGDTSAQQTHRPSQERRCVGLRDIERTVIADNQTVLFYLHNGDIFQNRLARMCPGLDDRATLMYRVVLDQLCDLDTINVLENYGFAFVQTAACSLGTFTRIDPAAADALLNERESR